MTLIEFIMLAVQIAILSVAVWTVLGRKPTPDRPRPIWSSLGVSLAFIAMVSWNIAYRRATEPAAQFLMYGSPLLLGFAIAMFSMALRERRFGNAG